MAMIVEVMEHNGSNMPVYETDRDRTYLTVTVPIHPDFVTNASSTESVPKQGRRGPEELRKEVLRLLDEEGCLRAADIASRLGYAGMNPTLRRCIDKLIEEGEVAYLYPDTPNSSRQRICRKGYRIR